MIWQGEPEPWAIANRVFHVRTLAVYFVALMVVHLVYQLMDGGGWPEILAGLSWQLAISLTALGLLTGAGFLYARSTVYTFTNRRLVLRSGVAVPMMVNVPWSNVESAGLRVCSDGTGDIVFSAHKDQKLYRMMLWPHVRPWRFRHVEPLLRGIPDPQRVAKLLAGAVRAGSDAETATVTTAAVRPTRTKDRSFETDGQTAPAL